jgi:undecaprenyl-diphosphatase
MMSLNHQLFLVLNASDGASPTTISVAQVLADDVIYLVPVVLIGLWVWGRSSARAGLLATAIAGPLALLANQAIGLFWYEPRPFMIGLGRTLLHHMPENSFPSDHTTLIVTIGIGLLATGAARRWGVIVVTTGILVGWARIYLGLHFPIDIFSSVLIAALVGMAAALLMPAVGVWVAPTIERMYDRVLDAIHLPIGLFPRR